MPSFGSISYNVDINQLGASQYPRFSVSQPTPYQDGLVEDIILGPESEGYEPDGSNIGYARIRFIPGDRGVPIEKLNWVPPLDSSIREYPLRSELVLVFYSLGKLFYTRRINSTNKITESSWPGLSEQFSPAAPSEDKSELAQIAASGGNPYRPWGIKQQLTVGDEFSENPNVRMLKPYEGDLIIQGRFGNFLRFGSSLLTNPTSSTPQPNLLLTVGQAPNKPSPTKVPSVYSLVQEDINKDKSCIWMVTDEKILLQPGTINSVSNPTLRSAETSNINNYTGAQIFINSDRVILNSKLNEISLFSNKEINLSAVQSITIDSAKSVLITADEDIQLTTPRDITLSAKTISFNSPGDISYSTSKNYTISGKKIYIGSEGDESQPMVLGGELSKWLGELIKILILPGNILTAVGPAAFEPQTLVRLTNLAIQLGLTPQSAVFNSRSNFTSKTNN